MRVVLAEDLFLLRDGLVRMLEAYDFEIAAAVETGPELTRALAELKADGPRVDRPQAPGPPDVGVECALAARRARPGLPVLVLSQHVEQLYARELLADGNGAIGYLLKDRVFDADQFIDAVRRVAAGGTAMDPQVISQLLSRRSQDKPMGGLTPREREVMEQMAQGRSNAAIASHMVITERAVAKHTSNIFGKLGLPPSDDDNRRVLAVLAYLDRG
ncbi:LuxR C-terminal-related transcriptional regulator [Streptomyces sp. NPDC059814]|uniref:LuxR C-terminal-related transcriptional regulator n=1 Tax=Streptomyces sp. NPDC059814 TaxID=3346959 RepID=UPI00365A02ED